jgi:DNA-binding HxlR family transcriptional regulator/putative sterol carrier protein
MVEMKKRAYDQYCGLAQALDLIGERWALLIVRELLMGPKRYTDLRAGLPGIATNLLADRLKSLEEIGVVRREHRPPPVAATVYELTERGRALEGAIIELGRWGGMALGPPEPDQDFKASWFALGMRATFRPAVAGDAAVDYEFRIGDEVFSFELKEGDAHARQGPADSPDLVLDADPQTFLALLGGQLAPRDALEGGAARIEGSKRELTHMLRVFRFPADQDSGRSIAPV